MAIALLSLIFDDFFGELVAVQGKLFFCNYLAELNVDSVTA